MARTKLEAVPTTKYRQYYGMSRPQLDKTLATLHDRSSALSRLVDKDARVAAIHLEMFLQRS